MAFFLLVPLVVLAEDYWKKLDKEKKERTRKQREEEELQRKKVEHEEQERLKRQKEEDERRRKEAEEIAARAKWAEFHESKTMVDVSMMTGLEFERFLKRLFTKMGYTNISLTPPNDQGGDLLCVSPGGTRIVVQAKRWRDSVGNGAVQELLGAMLLYDCVEGMVVTSSMFTAAAQELAGKDPRISLRDGRWLEKQIKEFLPCEIPEFNWEEYNQVVRDYKPGRTSRKRRSRFRRQRSRPWY
jgi:restriction endonuclease Mrr